MSSQNVGSRVFEGLTRPLDVAASAETRCTALQLLLSRFSTSPKYLTEPGPSDEELSLIALAALRAPDHAKLIPFRFVVARKDGLARLADLFVDYGRRHGKNAAELDVERQRAMQAPVVIAVVARIDHDNAKVPAHEQWECVGGAISNAMSAVHIMGYAGKMLSGVRAADPMIRQAYCNEGEILAGWISVGTPMEPAKVRGEIDPARILTDFWP